MNFSTRKFCIRDPCRDCRIYTHAQTTSRWCISQTTTKKHLKSKTISKIRTHKIYKILWFICSSLRTTIMFEGEGVFLHYIKNEQDTLCQREQETTTNPNELLAQKALYQPNLWNGIHNQGSKRTSF